MADLDLEPKEGSSFVLPALPAFPSFSDFLFYYINTSEIPSELSRENFISSHVKIYMLFTGREVRMGKNCARGLEYGPRP